MNYKYCKIIICIVFLFTISFKVFAEDEVEKLRNDILELEKFANPFVQLFQKVSSLLGPSVVSIVAEEMSSDFIGPHDILPSPFSLPEDGQEEHRRQPSFGSGVVVKKTGYILTNFHVIDGFENETIIVTLHNGENYDAVVVGKDPSTDLAILKIPCDNLREAVFGDPKSVKVGDWVIAIGSPFGYSQTVSAGIVSAIGRTKVTPFPGPFAYEDFIQTDAAINPGNSGGPLVNLRGQVIGINSAIATRTGGSQGVGFAISINIANEVINDLIEKGRVVRGYLGVGIQDINDALAFYLKLESKNDVIRMFRLGSDKGAFISEVWLNTPASKGNIRPGDVIVGFNEKDISDANGLQRAIRKAGVNEKVKIKVVRNNKVKILEVGIDPQPESMSGKTFLTIRDVFENTNKYMGLMIENMAPGKIGPTVYDDNRGVFVKYVEADSPAQKAGIVPGDIILMVGTKEVNSIDEFQSALNEFIEKGKTVSVFIKSKGDVALE